MSKTEQNILKLIAPLQSKYATYKRDLGKIKKRFNRRQSFSEHMVDQLNHKQQQLDELHHRLTHQARVEAAEPAEKKKHEKKRKRSKKN